jgi:hypothetical protein
MSNKRWITHKPNGTICTVRPGDVHREGTKVSGAPPSSVDVLTSLQAQQLAKKLEK